MMKAGRSRMKHLIRGEVVQKRGGKSVDNVDSLLCREVPKVMSNFDGAIVFQKDFSIGEIVGA